MARNKAFVPALSPSQVRQIRERYARGGVTVMEMATNHKVSATTIYSAIRGKSYKSAGGPIVPNIRNGRVKDALDDAMELAHTVESDADRRRTLAKDFALQQLRLVERAIMEL